MTEIPSFYKRLNKKIISLIIILLSIIVGGCDYFASIDEDIPGYVGTWKHGQSQDTYELLILNKADFLIEDIPLDYAKKGELYVEENVMTLKTTHHWDDILSDYNDNGIIDNDEWLPYNGEEGPAEQSFNYYVSDDTLLIISGEQSYEYNKM